MTGLPDRLRAWSDDAVMSGYECPAASVTMRMAANRIEALELQLLAIRNGVPQVLRDEGFLVAVDELLGLD